MKVLIIDDDTIVLDVTRATLEEQAHEVITLRSAVGAASVIKREQPDVVLLDIAMPGLSGDSWLRLVREQQLLGPDADTPFVLFSSCAADELERLVEATGAAGYIAKEGGPERFAGRFAQIASRLRAS
ncbi:MAG: response regulator [Myxococcota bacterium]|nr:response regulator [Myxococcota bacterium]